MQLLVSVSQYLKTRWSTKESWQVTFKLFKTIQIYIFNKWIGIEPWTHVMLASIGGYIGYNYFRWSDQLLVAVNEKRVERGMVPIERKRYN